MRKMKMKKMYGTKRGKYYKLLREAHPAQETIVLKGRSGNVLGESIINPLKHLLMSRPYKSDQHNDYLADVLKQYKAFLEQVNNEQEAAETAEVIA